MNNKLIIYNGQAEQDKFVLNILSGKKNGYFLELGSCFAEKCNNTFILENSFNWIGIMIEYDNKYLYEWNELRPNSKHIINDALNINYKNLLKDSPKNIDYLSLDLEVSNGSTIKTLEKFDIEIMNEYKFAVITFEHDLYNSGDYKETRIKSRNIFKKHGYIPVFKDINNNNPNIVYEDWYVHPELVNMNYVNNLKEINKNNYKDNNLTGLSINWKDIIYPQNDNLLFITDSNARIYEKKGEFY